MPAILLRCGRSLQWLVWSAAIGLGLLGGFAAAQNPDPAPSALERPLLVVAASSVDRLLEEADLAFEAVGRAELSELLSGALAQVNDLRGIPRNKPVGLMLFVEGITFQPVVFVPVDKFDDLTKTVAATPLTLTKTGDNTFELKGRRGPPSQVRLERDYAFISPFKPLAGPLPDPQKLLGGLTASYDLAVSLQINSLAPQTRDVFLTLLRTSTEAQLQRKDTEPEGAHRIRKAAGLRNLDVLEQLLTQAEQITLGWSIARDTRKASLEAVILARPGTEYAQLLNDLAHTRSQFAGWNNPQAPLTFSLATRLDKSASQFFQEIFAGAQTQIGQDLKKPNNPLGEEALNPVTEILQVLRATTDQGVLDGALQMVGPPGGPFVFVAGVRVADDARLSTALAELLGRLKSLPELETVVLNSATHQGIGIHRLQGKRSRPQEERLYGSKPSLYLAAGKGALWLAFGGDAAVTELKSAIDRAAQPLPDITRTAPLQLVVNLSQWTHLLPQRENPRPIEAAWRKSFAQGGDALRLELQPIQDGARLRLELDPGFLRLIGHVVAANADRRLNRPAVPAKP